MPPEINLLRYIMGSGPGIADVRVACGLPPTKNRTTPKHAFINSKSRSGRDQIDATNSNSSSQTTLLGTSSNNNKQNTNTNNNATPAQPISTPTQQKEKQTPQTPSNKHAFTPEEDAWMLDKLAKQGKGGPFWSSIAKHLGRSQEQCRDRYEELVLQRDRKDAAAAAPAAAATDWDVKPSKPTTTDWDVRPSKPTTTDWDVRPTNPTTITTAGAAKSPSSTNNNSKTPPSKPTTTANPTTPPANTVPTTATAARQQQLHHLLPSADFSPSELHMLTDLYRRECEGVWLRVASGFWDRTGRRLHPEDVRGVFGG